MADREFWAMTVVFIIVIAAVSYNSLATGEISTGFALQFGGIILLALILVFLLVRLYVNRIRKRGKAHEEWFEFEKK